MRSNPKDRVVVAPQPSRLWYKAVKMLQVTDDAVESCGDVVVCHKIRKEAWGKEMSLSASTCKNV